MAGVSRVCCWVSECVALSCGQLTGMERGERPRVRRDKPAAADWGGSEWCCDAKCRAGGLNRVGRRVGSFDRSVEVPTWVRGASRGAETTTRVPLVAWGKRASASPPPTAPSPLPRAAGRIRTHRGNIGPAEATNGTVEAILAAAVGLLALLAVGHLLTVDANLTASRVQKPRLPRSGRETRGAGSLDSTPRPSEGGAARVCRHEPPTMWSTAADTPR